MRIKEYQDFVKFIKPLVKLHLDKDSLLAPDMGSEDFAYYLINHYVNDSYFYGKLDDENVLYFLAVINLDSAMPLVWLLYVHHSVRGSSKELVNNMLDDLRKAGKTQVSFETTHLTSSYERWVKKFGAKKHSISYRIEL